MLHAARKHGHAWSASCRECMLAELQELRARAQDAEGRAAVAEQSRSGLTEALMSTKGRVGELHQVCFLFLRAMCVVASSQWTSHLPPLREIWLLYVFIRCMQRCCSSQHVHAEAPLTPHGTMHRQ